MIRLDTVITEANMKRGRKYIALAIMLDSHVHKNKFKILKHFLPILTLSVHTKLQ